MDDKSGYVMGPAHVRPFRRGPWMRADHPAVRLLTRAQWIWTVHIRHRRKYKGVFD